MNGSLCFNPIVARIVPYSTLGAGGVVLHGGAPLLSVTVFDALDTTTTSGLDTLFSRSAVLVGELRLPTKFLDLPGHQIFGAVWSSRSYTTLDRSRFLDPILIGGAPGRETGSWACYY